MNFSSPFQNKFTNTAIPCPICSSSERRQISNIGRNFQLLETVICTGCGLIHSNPIPSKAELDEFYREQYRSLYKASSEPKLKHILRYAPGALGKLQFMKKYATSEQKILLDVGSGSGEFLFMATKAGLNARGIEPHSGYSRYTKEKLGLDVENTTLESARLENDSVDIINLSHVLEHMPTPLETLCYLHLVLKKGGLLLVEVPDISVCNHAPWTKFHYAHIYNFNHKTLKALVEKAGFEILNPEATTTNIIAKKVSRVCLDKNFIMQENYEELWKKMMIHTSSNHYTSKKPYTRVLRKLWQYPKEFLITMCYKDASAILNRTYINNKNRSFLP